MGCGDILKSYCLGENTEMKKSIIEIFEKNINVLLQHNWEPEIEFFFDDGRHLTIFVYFDFIEVIDETGVCCKYNNIKQFIKNLKWNQIKKIQSLNDMDFTIPIEKQSVIIDGELWLNVSDTNKKI